METAQKLFAMFLSYADIDALKPVNVPEHLKADLHTRLFEEKPTKYRVHSSMFDKAQMWAMAQLKGKYYEDWLQTNEWKALAGRKILQVDTHFSCSRNVCTFKKGNPAKISSSWYTCCNSAS